VWVGIKRKKEKKGRNDRKFSVGGYKEKRKRKGGTIENLVWVGIKRKKEKKVRNDRKFSVGGYEEKSKEREKR